jgi:hypothetical protein
MALAMAHCALPAQAQIDPRPVLNSLIFSFQNCGHWQSYLQLGAFLYQQTWQQSGGSGCFAFFQSFGPVQSMNVTNQVSYPAGPIYAIETTHPNGKLYWQIGISLWTGKVEHLTANTLPVASPPQPVVTQPNGPNNNQPNNNQPNNNQGGQSRPVAKQGSSPPVDPQAACIVYAGMCPP